MRKILLTLLVLFLACGKEATPPVETAASSTPRPASTRTSDTPSITGRVDIDIDAGTVDADLTITLDPGDQAELELMLAGSLDISEVSGPDVIDFGARPMQPDAAWHTVTVTLAADRTPGPVAMRFRYAGSPAFPESRINAIGPEWVELSVDSAWYPIQLGAAFEVDVTIGLPAEWTVVAPGPVEATDDGFQLRSLGTQIDLVFTAAPALDMAEGDGARVFHRGASEETTNAVLRATATCREILDRRFGAEEPLPDVSFTIPDREEAGYARKTFIALTNVDPDDEVRLTGFLCHELAHFWSSGADWQTVDNWLNEGFAVFISAQAVRELFGDQAWLTVRADWEQRAEGQPSIWTPDDLERRPFAVNYKKAPLALARLEAELEPEPFDRWLVRYMTDPIDDTPSLLAALEDEAGQQARLRFEHLLAEEAEPSPP